MARANSSGRYGPGDAPAVSTLALVEGLERMGLSLDALKELDLPSRPVPSDAVVPVDTWRTIVSAALDASSDPALAVSVGLAVPFGGMGVVDYLVASSADVRSGMRSLVHHFAALAAVIRLELVEADDGGGWLYFRPATGLEVDEVLQFGLEFSFGVTVSRFRAMSVPAVKFARVALTRARHPAFTERLGLPVVFQAESIGLEASRADLDSVLSTADPRLHDTLLTVMNDLNLGGRNAPLETAVRARLRDLLTQGHVDGGAVARALGISERTLGRRLADVGTTFRDVLDNFRAEESERMLLAGEESLAEIAATLGYNDQSAWTKAFRRWRGKTPAAWLKSVTEA